MQLHMVPDLPWSTDLFVLVDSYSGWFELDPIKKITSQCVINKLKRHFSVHGISYKQLSDCGTQYTSQTFKDLAKDWDFTHITSSPEYHQASANHLLETLKRDGTDLFHNLNIKNVLRDGTLGSPAQQLLSRVTRTDTCWNQRQWIPRWSTPIYQRGVKDKKDSTIMAAGQSLHSKTPKWHTCKQKKDTIE